MHAAFCSKTKKRAVIIVERAVSLGVKSTAGDVSMVVLEGHLLAMSGAMMIRDEFAHPVLEPFLAEPRHLGRFLLLQVSVDGLKAVWAHGGW